MKSARISLILVLAFGFMVCPDGISHAAPMGTVFTYQGRLIDANSAADGLYDFQFKLYDANIAGVQKGSTINSGEVDVIDGYFTVELDFGSVFDGSARWLQIGVRAGELNDPNVYTALSPRQEVTATPYALYAKTAGSGADSDWIIWGNNMYSGVSGNVGIGTTSPVAKLEVTGNINATASISGMGAVIKGRNTSSGYGVYGEHTASGNYGLLGHDLTGVFGEGDSYGVMGYSGTGKAVFGYSNTGYAGYFDGNVYITSGGLTTNSVDATILREGGTSLADKYLGKTATAADSDKIDGLHANDFLSTASDYGRSGVASVLYEGTTPLENKYVNQSGDTVTASTSGNVIYVQNTGSGIAIYGRASNSSGVQGVSDATTGVFGETASTSNAREGVKGRGPGRGVAGFATATSGIAYGVYGDSSSINGIGVYGASPQVGVQGKATSTTATNYGGYFESSSSYGYGIFAKSPYIGVVGTATSSSGTNWGVMGGTSSSSGYAGYFTGGRNYFEGSVGIGTTSPSYKLHVIGDIAYTGNIYDVSDFRLKENITPLRKAVEKVSSLRGIYFNNKGESPDKREVGVIAQDVEKVLPELVSTNEQGYKSVDYTKLTPVLIEAVKELKAENESLKQRLEAQEKTLQELQTVIMKGLVQ